MREAEPKLSAQLLNNPNNLSGLDTPLSGKSGKALSRRTHPSFPIVSDTKLTAVLIAPSPMSQILHTTAQIRLISHNNTTLCAVPRVPRKAKLYSSGLFSNVGARACVTIPAKGATDLWNAAHYFHSTNTSLLSRRACSSVTSGILHHTISLALTGTKFTPSPNTSLEFTRPRLAITFVRYLLKYSLDLVGFGHLQTMAISVRSDGNPTNETIIIVLWSAIGIIALLVLTYLIVRFIRKRRTSKASKGSILPLAISRPTPLTSHPTERKYVSSETVSQMSWPLPGPPSTAMTTSRRPSAADTLVDNNSHFSLDSSASEDKHRVTVPDPAYQLPMPPKFEKLDDSWTTAPIIDNRTHAPVGRAKRFSRDRMGANGPRMPRDKQERRRSKLVAEQMKRERREEKERRERIREDRIRAGYDCAYRG